MITKFVLENVNGFVVLAGVGWLLSGIADVSRPTAKIVAGLLVMAIGMFPYLRRRRKP